jgi:dienelactone hydrolase
VSKPEGRGPFPAVIVLHTCAGVRRGDQISNWSKRLLTWGYLVAVPDSFSPRNHPNGVCGDGRQVGVEARTRDTYAVMRYLEGRPDVVVDRIGVIGFSHGGWAVLGSVYAPLSATAKRAAGAQHELAAAVALYPECEHGPWSFTFSGYRSTAPLLILAGSADDWTPAAPCKNLAEHALPPPPVAIKVYPDAHHGFDTYSPVTRVAAARRGKGATIGGQPAAREDSIKEVHAFFAKYLQATDTPGKP